jgi:hypothetical protein
LATALPFKRLGSCNVQPCRAADPLPLCGGINPRQKLRIMLTTALPALSSCTAAGAVEEK